MTPNRPPDTNPPDDLKLVAQPGGNRDMCRKLSDPSSRKDNTMPNMKSEMADCIEKCLRCYAICLSTVTRHGMELGGENAEPAHLRLMLACSEMCRTSAHFMLIGTVHHKHTCKECAEICLECATECDRVGGMQECANACRACAEICSRMAA